MLATSSETHRRPAVASCRPPRASRPIGGAAPSLSFGHASSSRFGSLAGQLDEGVGQGRLPRLLDQLGRRALSRRAAPDAAPGPGRRRSASSTRCVAQSTPSRRSRQSAWTWASRRPARRRIEAHRRLVEDQDARARAGAPAPARPCAGCRRSASRHARCASPARPSRASSSADARRGPAAGKPVEPRVEAEVRLDGQVEVQRRLLEDHAEPGERGDEVPADVEAVDHDAPAVGHEEAGQDLEQRGLARAVRARAAPRTRPARPPSVTSSSAFREPYDLLAPSTWSSGDVSLIPPGVGARQAPARRHAVLVAPSRPGARDGGEQAVVQRAHGGVAGLPRAREVDGSSRTTRAGPGERNTHAVGDRQRLPELVRHVEHGGPRALPQLDEMTAEPRGGGRVQRRPAARRAAAAPARTANARASATRRCMPPDSRAGKASSTSPSPTSCRSRRARAVPSAASPARTSRRLSSTVSHGIRREAWNIMPIRTGGAPVRPSAPWPAVDLDRALERAVETGDDVQERALPAAGRPDDAHDLRRRRRERERLQGRTRRARVGPSRRSARRAGSRAPPRQPALQRAQPEPLDHQDRRRRRPACRRGCP